MGLTKFRNTPPELAGLSGGIRYADTRLPGRPAQHSGPAGDKMASRMRNARSFARYEERNRFLEFYYTPRKLRRNITPIATYIEYSRDLRGPI